MYAERLHIALNAQNTPAEELGCIAVNLHIPEGEEVPEWVELIPPGAEVRGRDGRGWINDRPDEVVAAFRDDFHPIPIDIEHATTQSGFGTFAPAAAWIEELEIRENGAIWGRARWNDSGRFMVGENRYRFLSPVFSFDGRTSRIKQLFSAALTNKPNLRLTALNSRNNPNEATMNELLEKLIKALNLPESASENDVLTALNKLQGELQTAVNHRESPSLDKFVPRADFDAVKGDLEKSNLTVNNMRQKALEDEAETEIKAALEAKKITPATVEYHKASCMQEGGLEKFREFVKAAPEVAPDSGLDGKDPAGAGANGLTPDELAICSKMGLEPEAFKATRDGKEIPVGSKAPDQPNQATA